MTRRQLSTTFPARTEVVPPTVLAMMTCLSTMIFRLMMVRICILNIIFLMMVNIIDRVVVVLTDDGPPPDDEDSLPADDEDELPPDEEDQPPMEAKRPSRRISRPRVDSAEIFSDMDDSSLQDSQPPGLSLSANAKVRGSGGGGPVSKSKPPPPPPPGPPPKTLMAQRLQSGQNQPAVKYSESSIEEDLASLSVGLLVSVPLKLDHSKAKEAIPMPPSARQLGSDVPVPKPQGKGAVQRDSLIAAFDNIDFSPTEVSVSVQPRLEKEIVDSASLVMCYLL
jgi:hypothetical protein